MKTLRKNPICNLEFATAYLFPREWYWSQLFPSRFLLGIRSLQSDVFVRCLWWEYSWVTVQYTILSCCQALIREGKVVGNSKAGEINWTVPDRSSMLSFNDGVGWLVGLQRRPIKCPGKRLGSRQRLCFTDDMNGLTGATVQRKYLYLQLNERSR